MSRSVIHDVVVGMDGSPESSSAARWAAASLSPAGRLHAIHVLRPVEELAVDAVLADSVALRHHRERELNDTWVADLSDLAGAEVVVMPSVREGAVAAVLLDAADEVDADLVVVGHHAHLRHGPQIVGHVTADLLHHSSRPVVVVPDGWDPVTAADGDVVVGVGVASGTVAALRWAMRCAPVVETGLSLVHALGGRSLFRPDGLLDVLGYHLDPSVLPAWVEQDLTALADRVRAEAGVDVGLSVTVQRGRVGPVLVEAGQGAQLLVIGRGEPPFVRRHVMAPYLHHAIVNAPCPVVVVPAGPGS